MFLLRMLLVLATLVMLCNGEGCQPELVEDPGSLVTVGYDRQRKTAMYIDTLSVEMKNKKKFDILLTNSCNGRRDASVTIEMRKEGSADWEEKARDIRITAKHNDDIKNLDPCSIYEIRVLIVPKNTGGEVRPLPIFKIGPYHEQDPKDIAIAKFKGDGEQYYKDNFKSEYTQVTDHSFTVKWDPICALGFNIFVKDEEEEDWVNAIEKTITNEMENPTTEVTFDVPHCKVFEVIFEFAIDSEGVEIYERELTTVTTDPNKEVIKAKFMEHSFDNISNVLKWDYTHVMEDFDCIESFNYKLVKDENGDTDELKKVDYEDVKEEEFDVGSLVSECNFGIRTEIEYETVEKHVASLDGFEIHIHKEDQKDNSISVNATNIMFEVNPCVEPNSEIVIGLAEIGREGKELHGRMLDSNLAGQVSVDKSMSIIKRSDFDETELSSCMAFKIMLLRRSNQEFKELETAEFDNPKWETWEAPTIVASGNSSNSITIDQIIDNETNGGCIVRHYNVKCAEVGGDNTEEKIFQPNEELKLENLMPETEYNCTGRIVHTIPGSGDLETPWSDFVVIETAVAPEPETTPTPEFTTAANIETHDIAGDSESNIGLKDEPEAEADADAVVAVAVIAIIVVIVLAGGCYWWKFKRVPGGGGNDDADINLSYRASVTAGTKVVEMNSSALTDTEEDTSKDIVTAKTSNEETVVDMPEENLATTSTGGTAMEEVTNKEQSDSTVNQTGGTDNEESANKEMPGSTPAPTQMDTSPDVAVPPKEPDV